MSLKLEKLARISYEPPKLEKFRVTYQEPVLKWAEHVTYNIEDDFESISSEEDSGSEYDLSQRQRTKPMGEIWQVDQIWEQLQLLPGAEEIAALLRSEDEKSLGKLLERKSDEESTVLISSWLGKDQVLEKLLQNGAKAQVEDELGRTALHLATLQGNEECVRLLLKYGAKINAWDKKQKATPLHCAASKCQLGCLKILIENRADVNAGLTSNKSALHYAVQSLAIECVQELLEHNASPNTPQVYSETPMHIAASLGAQEIIALLIKHGAAVNVQYGAQKLTPLHLVAEDGCANCAQLLIDAGANLMDTNHKNQTPLHLAALSNCLEILEIFLSKGADPNAKDVDGRTPLHCAIVKVSRCCDCVKLLLHYGGNVNQPDSFGYTPLHLAALNENSHLVMLLINKGGDVTARTNGGISVLTFITRKTPDVIPKYIEKFDSSISLHDHEIGDVDCEVKLDFRILVPTVGNKETELLLNFIEVGHKEILKHPLSETFMFLKWRRIRKFFLFSFIYHAFFILLFSIYIQGVFLKNCPSARKLGGGKCQVRDFIKAIGYILIFFNVTLLVKELYELAQDWYIYLKHWENWLQWLIVICIFGCVQPTPSMNIQQNVDSWQHHMAAIGIFLAWVGLMMIVGRFPMFGLYIQMFTTVSYNFTKFVMAYFCLLIAFALSFGVLFASYPAFHDLKWTIMKVIVMMSGELEFEDIFYDNDYPIIYSYTAHIMFLAFVVLVAVVLTNLMVGLAVSDIQGLQQSAGLDRLVRQAELVAHLEGMLFSKLLTCIPYKLMKCLHKQALLLKSEYHWALYIRPNDPREVRIPKELVKSIYQIVAERKERPRSKKKKHSRFKSDNDLSSVSPPLTPFIIMRDNSSIYKKNKMKKSSLRAQLFEIKNEFSEFAQYLTLKIEDTYQNYINRDESTAYSRQNSKSNG